MVALVLKDQGIDVVAVGNGEAAVRKISDIRPDLVLADVFMPVRNGYEVCEYVKTDRSLAHIPVILLVGAFDPLDEQEAQRVGADGVLKKPFVPPDPLISMVKSALSRAAAAHPPQAAAEPARSPAAVPPAHEVISSPAIQIWMTVGHGTLRAPRKPRSRKRKKKRTPDRPRGEETGVTRNWKRPSRQALIEIGATPSSSPKRTRRRPKTRNPCKLRPCPLHPSRPPARSSPRSCRVYGKQLCRPLLWRWSLFRLPARSPSRL